MGAGAGGARDVHLGGDPPGAEAAEGDATIRGHRRPEVVVLVGARGELGQGAQAAAVETHRVDGADAVVGEAALEHQPAAIRGVSREQVVVARLVVEDQAVRRPVGLEGEAALGRPVSCRSAVPSGLIV
jgi:hypothetical protein